MCHVVVSAAFVRFVVLNNVDVCGFASPVDSPVGVDASLDS